MVWYPGGDMKINLRDGLPFVTATLLYRGRILTLDSVLLDTGSGGTVFATDRVLTINLTYEASDLVRRIRGIGGAEFVFSKRVDQLAIGEMALTSFEVEIGAMDYGFPIDGIVGMDWLLPMNAMIDLDRLELYQSRPI